MTSRLKYFAEDLLTLEINTILVSDEIKASEEFYPRQALITLAESYNLKLKEIADKYKSNFKEMVSALELSKKTPIGSHESYTEIYERSKLMIDTYEGFKSPDGNADIWMLYRIKNNSRSISNILKDIKNGLLDKISNNKDSRDNDQGSPLTADEIVVIRKAWELGTQEIAIQTVLQLDGDVVTRVQTGYTKEIYNGLHEIHNQGVTTSVKFWKILVELIQYIVESIWKLILPLK